MKPLARVVLAIMIGLAATAFSQQSATGAASMRLTSSAFGAGAAIPQQFTCKGADASPSNGAVLLRMRQASR